MQDDAVLRHFSLSRRHLLGSGGESRVYLLGEDQVLRVYGAGADPSYVKRLQVFYSTLRAGDLPFAVPFVQEIGNLGRQLYAIETRLRGAAMTQHLLTATGPARTASLRSYLAAAAYIKTIPVDIDEFGELLATDPVRRREWPAFLLARARQTLRQSGARMSVDVPALEEVVASWEQDLGRLSDVQTPKFVHGDYFPGNVLVDDAGDVTAIIDFSPLTVAGDPRLDLICALIFLELDEGYQPSDSRVIRRLIEEGPDSGILDLEHLYRTYYALYFSNVPITHPGRPAHRGDQDATDERWYDLGMYRWCVQNLLRARV